MTFLYLLIRIRMALSHPVWFNIQPHGSKSPVVTDRGVRN
jgi:hypothetical protein